jgi:hypothetical protein
VYRILRSLTPSPVLRTLPLLGLIVAVVVLASTGRVAAQAGGSLKPAYFMDRQVIITGPQSDVDAFVRNFNADNQGIIDLGAGPKRRVHLSYASRLSRTALPCFPAASVNRATLVSDLYMVNTTLSIPEVIERINTYAGARPCVTPTTTQPGAAGDRQLAAATSYMIYADPNYAIGRPPVPTTGDPWSIQDFDAGASTAAGAGLFYQQWALGPQPQGGISLYASVVTSPTLVLTRTVPETGQGVRVGIFDTSPFSVTMGTTATVTFQGLTLDVSHVISPVFPLPAPITPTLVADHGLFGASLIAAVAPDARITLIRVLDDYGQGDLFTLNAALGSFISETLALSPQPTGTVLNLSLGVHPDPSLPPPPEISALKTVLGIADGLGITVVAATGNDSTDLAVTPMQIPAIYTPTIAVGGSTHDRKRSCFSNAARVAAPAGDGQVSTDLHCTPWSWSEANPLIPQHYLVGMSTSSATGYAYWLGTSFAAPLATGVSAVVLEKRGLGTTPAQVATSIYVGAAPTNPASCCAEIKNRIVNLRRSITHPRVFLPTVALTALAK